MSEMENALDRICGGSHVAKVNKDLKLEGINTETIQSETHGWSRWENETVESLQVVYLDYIQNPLRPKGEENHSKK